MINCEHCIALNAWACKSCLLLNPNVKRILKIKISFTHDLRNQQNEVWNLSRKFSWKWKHSLSSEIRFLIFFLQKFWISLSKVFNFFCVTEKSTDSKILVLHILDDSFVVVVVVFNTSFQMFRIFFFSSRSSKFQQEHRATSVSTRLMQGKSSFYSLLSLSFSLSLSLTRTHTLSPFCLTITHSCS